MPEGPNNASFHVEHLQFGEGNNQNVQKKKRENHEEMTAERKNHETWHLCNRKTYHASAIKIMSKFAFFYIINKP